MSQQDLGSFRIVSCADYEREQYLPETGVIYRTISTCQKISDEIASLKRRIEERSDRASAMASNVNAAGLSASELRAKIDNLFSVETAIAEDMEFTEMEIYMSNINRYETVRSELIALEHELQEIERQSTLLSTFEKKHALLMRVWCTVDHTLMDMLLGELPADCASATTAQSAIAALEKFIAARTSFVARQSDLNRLWQICMKAIGTAAALLNELNKPDTVFQRTLHSISTCRLDDFPVALDHLTRQISVQQDLASALASASALRREAHEYGIQLHRGATEDEKMLTQHAVHLIDLISIAYEARATDEQQQQQQDAGLSPVPEADVELGEPRSSPLQGLLELSDAASTCNDTEPATAEVPVLPTKPAKEAAKVQPTIRSFFEKGAASRKRKRPCDKLIQPSSSPQENDADDVEFVGTVPPEADAVAPSSRKRPKMDTGHVFVETSDGQPVEGQHTSVYTRLRCNLPREMPLKRLVDLKGFWNFGMDTQEGSDVHSAARQLQVYIQLIGVRVESLDTVLHEIPLFDTTRDTVMLRLTQLDHDVFSRSDIGYVMARLVSEDSRQLFTTFDLHEPCILWRIHWDHIFVGPNRVAERDDLKRRVCHTSYGLRVAAIQKLEYDPLFVLAVRGVSPICQPRVRYMDTSSAAIGSKTGLKYASLVACGWNRVRASHVNSCESSRVIISPRSKWDMTLYPSRVCDPESPTETDQHPRFYPYHIITSDLGESSAPTVAKNTATNGSALENYMITMTTSIADCTSTKSGVLYDFVCATSDLVSDSSAPIRDAPTISTNGKPSLPKVSSSLSTLASRGLQTAVAAAPQSRRKLLFYPTHAQGTNTVVLHVSQRLYGDNVADVGLGTDLSEAVYVTAGLKLFSHVFGYRIKVPITLPATTETGSLLGSGLLLCDLPISRQAKALFAAVLVTSPASWRTDFFAPKGHDGLCLSQTRLEPALHAIDGLFSIDAGRIQFLTRRLLRTAYMDDAISLTVSSSSSTGDALREEFPISYFFVCQPNAMKDQARTFLKWRACMQDITHSPIAMAHPSKAHVAFQRYADSLRSDHSLKTVSEPLNVSPFLHLYFMNPVSDNCVASATFELDRLPSYSTGRPDTLNDIKVCFIQLIFPGFGMMDIGMSGSRCVSAFEQLAFTSCNAYASIQSDSSEIDLDAMESIRGPLCVLQDASTFACVDAKSGVRYCPPTCVAYLHRNFYRKVKVCSYHLKACCSLCGDHVLSCTFYGRRGYVPVSLSHPQRVLQEETAAVVQDLEDSLRDDRWKLQKHNELLRAMFDHFSRLCDDSVNPGNIFPDIPRHTEFPAQFRETQEAIANRLHMACSISGASVGEEIVHLIMTDASFYLDLKAFAKRFEKRKARGMLVEFVLALLQREQTYYDLFWAKPLTVDSLQKTIRDM